MNPYIPHSGFRREPFDSLDFPTVRDLLRARYRISTIALQSGYVSRSQDISMADRPVFISGDGRFYTLFPNFKSTRRCFRIYFERS